MLFYIWAYFRVTGQQVYFFARRSLEPWNMLLCPDNMLRDPSIQSADLCLVYVMWYSTASSLQTYFSFFMLLFVFRGHTYSLEDVVSTSMSSFLTSCTWVDQWTFLSIFLMVTSSGAVKLILDSTCLHDSLRVSGHSHSFLLRPTGHIGPVVIIPVVFTQHILIFKNSSSIKFSWNYYDFFCANCFWLGLWFCDWFHDCHKKKTTFEIRLWDLCVRF